MRRVEGGEVCSVFLAIEANQVAVDSHSRSIGGVGGNTCPIGADCDVLRIAAAYDTHGSAGCGRLKVELYSRSVGNGKGDIAAHIGLGVWRAADVVTGSSRYIGIVLPVLHIPIFGGGVRLVGGEDGSVI